MRLLAIFFAISAFVYYFTGRSRKYSRRQRLIYALIAFVALFALLVVMILVSGDKP